MKILTFCDYFVPGYKGGGPITTLRNLAPALGPHYQLKIVTRDRDLGDVMPYSGVKVGKWNKVDGMDVLYLSPSQLSFFNIAALLKRESVDILYLNSFHSVPFSLFPLVARRVTAPNFPTVLATRGEFAAAALAIRGLRKRLYRLSLTTTGLLTDVTFQASSQLEALDINAALGNSVRVSVAPDVAAPISASPPRRAPKQAKFARLIFLGRISRMKNIDWLIREVGFVKANFELLIYGPIEDQVYWRTCEDAIADCTGSDRIIYRGPIQPSDVSGVLSAADGLVLPSLGENYGQVVAEALASGCPPIVSDRTPWQMLNASGAGWCIPLEEPDSWRSAIIRLAAMSEAKHASLRSAARRLAVQIMQDDSVISANKALFDNVLSGKVYRQNH